MLDANGPSSGSFDGTVITPNDITSPLTGKRAGAVRVTLLARRLSGGVDLGGGGGPDVFTRIGDVWYGASIVIADADGREVVVSTSSLGLRALAIDRGASPLARPVPPELEPLVSGAAEGLVCYRESLVLEGARVRLRATVFPIGPKRWETRPDFGPVVLHEIAPAPGSKARIS